MKHNIDMIGAVKEFHETYGLPALAVTQFPSADRVRLRLELIDEEREELDEALENSDLVEVADALGDILYVVIGMALEFGIPIQKVFDEIQRSNMSKLGADGLPIVREDGKILKGPNYSPPDIRSILYGS